MFLTFHLQQLGINVSYLVRKKEIQETFLKKVITVIDRYNQGKNISSGDSLTAGHYPRNKKQEEIIMMFSNIIFWIENYPQGKRWLNSIREQTHFSPNISTIENYFVNITSKNNPNYLIITNEEQLHRIRNHTDYELILSLPLL